MNITLVKLRGVVRSLDRITVELARIAECYERDLADKGIYVKPPKADTTGPPPTVEYVDEEHDWLRETDERLEREEKRRAKEEVGDESD